MGYQTTTSQSTVLSFSLHLLFSSPLSITPYWCLSHTPADAPVFDRFFPHHPDRHNQTMSSPSLIYFSCNIFLCSISATVLLKSQWMKNCCFIEGAQWALQLIQPGTYHNVTTKWLMSQGKIQEALCYFPTTQHSKDTHTARIEEKKKIHNRLDFFFKNHQLGFWTTNW